MISIVKRIIGNVLFAFYQSIGYALIVAVLSMFLYMLIKEHDWKLIVKRWVNEFKSSRGFRCVFWLILYATMILFRTLLNRNMYINPLQNVIGPWGIYNEKGELTTEIFENLALFIPYTVLLLCCFRQKLLSQKDKIIMILWQSIKHVFIFSLSIEFLQLFFRLGTFQLSDLFYNTLGGFVGGLIYWCGYKVTHWRKNKGVKEDEI